MTFGSESESGWVNSIIINACMRLVPIANCYIFPCEEAHARLGSPYIGPRRMPPHSPWPCAVAQSSDVTCVWHRNRSTC